MAQVITDSILGETLSFDDYLALTEHILANPAPQGAYANEKTLRYTRSNLERMQKVLNQMVLHQKLYNQLGSLHEKWIWLVLSEPWCGDASWGVPVLYLIARATENIDFRILLRDSHPNIMAAYKTNDSESIPKMVCLKADGLKELGTWGPRPGALQQLVMQWKNTPGLDYKESVRMLHDWYAADKGNQIQEEMTVLVKAWMNGGEGEK
jgi:Thioredoxin